MKITSGKRDDILRERDEWRAQKAEHDRRHAEEENAFREAEYAVTDPVKEYLMNELTHYYVLSFDVNVDRAWSWGNHRGLEVTIRCNENNKFDDDSALSWRLEVKMDKDGNVVKETGSWSGLKATTPAQLKSLRQSVQALEWLNDLDWVSIIDKDMPSYDDYFKEPHMENREGEFSKRLQEAELEDFIGKDIYFLSSNFESSGFWGRYVYVRIHRETPAQYVVDCLGYGGSDPEEVRERIKNAINENPDWLEKRYTQRVKKTNIHPITDNDGNIKKVVI